MRKLFPKGFSVDGHVTNTLTGILLLLWISQNEDSLVVSAFHLPHTNPSTSILSGKMTTTVTAAITATSRSRNMGQPYFPLWSSSYENHQENNDSSTSTFGGGGLYASYMASRSKEDNAWYGTATTATPSSSNSGTATTNASDEPPPSVPAISNNPSLPELSPKGIYQIKTEEQYFNLIEANSDKLVVIKFFASFCRACRSLESKLIAVKEDKMLEGLPIVWAEYESTPHNRHVFRDLRVVTLPTIHFYDGKAGSKLGLVENFPCPPTKIPLLKKKLSRFINSRVDPETYQLKELEEPAASDLAQEPCATRNAYDNEFITEEHVDFLRNQLPFFTDLTNDEFNEMLSKAKLVTYNPGDIIIRQGMPGASFFVLKSGVAEMIVRSRFDDPISTPPNYLGVVVNELKKFDYFGERALTTGEPYAASVRVLDKVRCFVFDVEDIPESSILSRKRRATQEMVEQLSHRYQLPRDYKPTYMPQTPKDACVLELLIRFKRIRQAARCFAYVMQSGTQWGDEGEIARRTMLWTKLSKAQRDEFQEVFDIVDVHKRGTISLLEMRRFMDSAREKRSDEEIMQMIARAAPHFRESTDYVISRDEFMGVMAEAEFFNLFTETFKELDRDNTGYVRAGDLDDVLGGVRDLISNDRTGIIDVEDKDMLVDYEQFSRMLLGAAL